MTKGGRGNRDGEEGGGGGYERKTLMKTKGAKDKKNAREKKEKKRFLQKEGTFCRIKKSSNI